MADWLTHIRGLEPLDAQTRERLSALPAMRIPLGHVVFRPGDVPSGFVVVLSGRVGVYMTGPNGREILLYAVTPGETCVQTTLGLLGEADYSAEAITETEVEAVVIPKPLFLTLMATSERFRAFVFRALAGRIQSVMAVIERVAFVKVEERLAAMLIERADLAGVVTATHQEIATAIGSVREVVSRRLEALARNGLVELERGAIRIVDGDGLRRMARPN